jgi:biotin transport system ATP-binding protein
MLQLVNVSHRFDQREVLSGLTLDLAERRIGVLGANGSGKSTFARLLNGLIVPSAGQVLVDGLDTRRDGKAVRRLVGFVFQDPDAQIVMPIVEEDVAFGLRGRAKSERGDVTAKVEAVLSRYGLADLRQARAHHLSGGQKQLLALSSVLVLEPKYLVLDEPTTLLDLRNRRRIDQALAELPQSIVVVTHDFDLIERFDRVLVFDAGRVVSLLHRLGAGPKLAFLAATGLGIFWIDDPWVLAAGCAGVAALGWLGGLPPGQLARSLRPLFLLLAIIVVVHGLTDGWETGVVAALRVLVLAGLAAQISASTTTTALLDALERWLRPFERVGVNPEKVGLTLALAIRFVPLLAERAGRIREAQRARGLDRNVLALLVPLLVTTVRLAESVADALDARGFGSRDLNHHEE